MRDGGVAGGMTPGMDDSQMCCGGGPPPSPLYASLMAVPELTPERREEFERKARERMLAGTAMLSEAFARLTSATQSGDTAAMQEANAQVREGLAHFESGLALRRAVTDGQAPRDVALDWFRREMNLVPLTTAPAPHGLFGLSWFHYVVMFTLAAFAIAMTGMHMRKTRRAELLVERLASASGAGAASDRVPIAAAAEAVSPPHVSVGIAPSKSNSWNGLLRVARIFQETANVKTFRLIEPRFDALPFSYLPGQFLTVTVSPEGAPIKRSYTISSSPTERDYCEITVKREEQGAVSRFLHDRVQEDDTLQITAPSGRFTFTGDEATSVVLIGGGVGITPMMSAVRYLTKRSWRHDIYLLYAARAETDIIFREELEHLRRRYRNLHVLIVTEHVEKSDEQHIKGRITRELLETRIPDLITRRVHICGPPPMMNAVRVILGELGVPADQIHTEIFQGKEPPRPTLETVPSAQPTVAVVTFARSRRTAMMSPTKTVLEAAEDVGVVIDYSCRVGTCGVCRTKLVAGVVTMEVQDGLEPGDKDNDIILACQAKATADLTVDA